MKLLVNATPLIPPLSGIGWYTQQLLLNLFNDIKVEDIDGFVPFAFFNQEQLEQMVKALEHQEKAGVSAKESSVSKIALLKNMAKKIPGARYLKAQIQQFLIERKFQQFQDRIYWESNYVLAPFEGKKVATVYDLSHIRHPDFHPQDRLKWLDKHLPQTIENADALIAISEFSKQEIMSVFNLSPDKISIVSPAVSSLFRQNYSTEQIQRFKSEYGLPERFVLSVGTLEPRKNIKGLVQSFARLPQALRRNFPLVLAGGKGWHMQEIDQAIEPLLKNGEIILLGYVPQQDMPLLYTSASVFAYVSLYEGYGMPIAEAMSCGTAVLTSNVASMPEVAGDGCEYADPNDSVEISQKLQQLMEDSKHRAVLEQRAKSISQGYRWENSTSRLIRVFESVA